MYSLNKKGLLNQRLVLVAQGSSKPEENKLILSNGLPYLGFGDNP